MEQATQTSIKDGFTSPSPSGSPRRHHNTSSDIELNIDFNHIRSSPRRSFRLSPSKTHLGFQEGNHDDAKGSKCRTAQVRTAGLHRRSRAHVQHSAAEDAYSSPRRQPGSEFRSSLFHDDSRQEPNLYPKSRQRSRTEAKSSSGVKENRPVVIGPDVAGVNSSLMVRSNTMTFGVVAVPQHRKSGRSVVKPSSATAVSNRRHCDACSGDYVRHWLKQNVARPEPEASHQRDADQSASDDTANMPYPYYTPMQLQAQDECAHRDPFALTTVSLPKKGLLKLTGLPVELNNPDVYASKREETVVKEQHRMYYKELMGPALPHTSDLYRGTLFRKPNIAKLVKEGTQLLEQEQRALNERNQMQEHDLVKHLLQYDMPEVPTINKNLQTFAGIPNGLAGEEQPTPDLQNVIDDSNIGNNSNNGRNSSKSNNSHGTHIISAITTPHTTSTASPVVIDMNSFPESHKNDHSTTNRPTHYQIAHNDSNNSSSSNMSIIMNKNKSSNVPNRSDKSRSAQDRIIRELDLNTRIQLPDSPRSLNLSGYGYEYGVDQIKSSTEPPLSARTWRDDAGSRSGATRVAGLGLAEVKKQHSDWPSSAWGQCDSLHSLLAHAQRVTLGKTAHRHKK